MDKKTNIDELIEIVYEGLVSITSIPVTIAPKTIDVNKIKDQINEIREALNTLINYYKDKDFVSKKLAISMVDISSAFFFKKGVFNDEISIFLEELQLDRMI